MGTNFYWNKLPPELERLKNPDNEEILMHIGKRSAAGGYCEDCGITFCQGGTYEVHGVEDDWWDKCPLCGSSGVYTCSFCWTFKKQEWLLYKHITDKEYWVVDEYGEKFDIPEFLYQEIRDCPIEQQVYWRFS